MSETELFKNELKIDEDCYDVSTDEYGHIVYVNIYDAEYMPFDYTGDIIRALGRFTYLRGIDIEVREFTITDISGLAVFEQLEFISFIDCCRVRDIEVLTNLKNLTHLSITNAGIESVSPLKDLKGLITLNLDGNNVSSINELKDHSHLTNVTLSHNALKDVSALAKSTEIKSLLLENNELKDLSFAKDLLSITYLRIERNNIEDISFLASLAQLTSLWIGHNPIKHITPIAALNNLKELDLSDLPIDNLIDLIGQKNLTYLSVGPVKDFKGEIISNLTNLTNLKLQNCQIVDLHFLKSLGKLFNVNLDNNAIVDFNPLPQLSQLKYISLKNNLIDKPFPRQIIEGWRSLDLTGNIFGNRLYGEIHNHFTGPSILDRDTADFWFDKGEYDLALAYFYADAVHKKSTTIYYGKLLSTDNSDDYFRLYYVMRCERLLRNIKEKDEDLIKMQDNILSIIEASDFFNKTELLKSLKDQQKGVSNYFDYSEYTAHLNRSKTAKVNPEILYQLGSKTFHSRDYLDELLSLYQQLFNMQHPLYLALSRTIAAVLIRSFAGTPQERIAYTHYKDLLLRPDKLDVPLFDTNAWFKKRYSNYIHDKPIISSKIEPSYPDVSAWKVLSRLILIVLIFLSLLKACR